jgi:hypothetical protein
MTESESRGERLQILLTQARPSGRRVRTRSLQRLWRGVCPLAWLPHRGVPSGKKAAAVLFSIRACAHEAHEGALESLSHHTMRATLLQRSGPSRRRIRLASLGDLLGYSDLRMTTKHRQEPRPTVF